MSTSLDRALELLGLIATGTNTLDGLAEAVGVHKSTVLRTLQTLERRSFVRRDHRHRYFIGAAVFELAQLELDGRDIRPVAAPALRDLGARTGQTVHLALYDHGVVSYIDKVESRQPLRMYSRIGLPAALHATAVAKVLLGGLPPDELERVLDTVSFERFTERTIDTPRALVAEVERSRLRGWAQDHEEHERFMNCISAPVFGPDGRIAAAVSVSVPNVVLPYEEVLGFLPAMLETAETISRDLGFTGVIHSVLPEPRATEPPTPESPTERQSP